MYQSRGTVYVCIYILYVQCLLLQGRRSRCGRCGGRRTNNMLSLAGKLLNLAVSSQDCTRNDLSLGEGPQAPLSDALCALPTLLGWRAARAMPLCRHDLIAPICKSALRLTKLTLLPTGLYCECQEADGSTSACNPGQSIARLEYQTMQMKFDLMKCT